MIFLVPLIEEALSLIKPQMSISLGGGSNVAKLASAIVSQSHLNLTICTPSEATKKYCESLGLAITNTDEISHIDLAFDGCDSLDTNLNALKSNGGIHLFEKINAELADEYIILAPFQRVTKQLSPQIPLTLEIMEKALIPIQKVLERLHLKHEVRLAKEIAGYARTPSGNLLIDCYSSNWDNIININNSLTQLNGVVATSFFENLVTLAITFDELGNIHKFRKED